MNYDLLLLVLFYIFLLIIFKIFRNKFEIQSKVFVLYKTKLGIKLMDLIAKRFPKTLEFIGIFSIIIGFIGMIITFAFICYATYKFLFIPQAEAALAPLLPGISISSSLPVLSFWHWIISILIVAGIHEFSHGVYARLKKIKIKSSGFAFLGPILAAFVEPDEKELMKRRTKDQLLVFSAGPFSNIILGIVVILFLALVFSPIYSNLSEVNGIVIGEINQSYPVNDSGLMSGYVIQEVNGLKINDTNILVEVLNESKPGDVLSVKANEDYYNVTLGKNPTNESKAIFGIGFSSYKLEVKEKFRLISWFYPALGWIGLLLFWIFNISIGVGLFNLLPIGPVDGGRMFYSLMLKLTKNKKIALKILSFFTLMILLMILINMLPFFNRKLKFLISPFI